MSLFQRLSPSPRWAQWMLLVSVLGALSACQRLPRTSLPRTSLPRTSLPRTSLPAPIPLASKSFPVGI